MIKIFFGVKQQTRLQFRYANYATVNLN